LEERQKRDMYDKKKTKAPVIVSSYVKQCSCI